VIRTHDTELEISAHRTTICSEMTGFHARLERCNACWGGAEAPQGIRPCRVVCSAGLRWCGGWRRTSLRGFHDQSQIEA
jgi:hypothetical protein